MDGGIGTLAASLDGSDHVVPENLVGGRYAVLGLLGSGAMGSVYRTYDHELDEVVALKTIRADVADTPGLLERLRLEVKLARRVTHRNVARVYDIGEHDGRKFITMELLEGSPLSAWVRPGGISTREAIELVLPICEGLDAAHAVGVVHRDLKPENVVVAPGGRVTITDFGVACLAESVLASEDIVGTPAYMAPEQIAMGGVVDARTDLYALGLIFFELLTGVPAFEGESAIVVATARLASDAPDVRTHKPEIDPEVAAIVAKALATKPDDRFPSARAFADALGDLATAPASRGAPAMVAPRARQVAVMPFTALGDCAADAHVASGLTDDLVEVMSMARGLSVRAWPRQAAAGDARAIGETLGVDLVVEGSVKRDGDAFVVAVTLTSVSDGFRIWSDTIRRPARELLLLNDAVAQAVCRAACAEGAITSRDAVSDPRVLEMWFRARRMLREGWYGFEEVTASVTLLEEAARRSPRDAAITATHALGLARLVFLDRSGNDDIQRRASEAARRAVLVAPHMGEAWLSLASIHVYEGASAKAVPSLVRAMNASSSLARAREMLGRLLVEAGLVTEGRRLLEAALSLDPLTFTPRWDIVQAHALTGRWDEAHALLALAVPDAAGESMRSLLLARFVLWRNQGMETLGNAPTGDDPGSLIARSFWQAAVHRTLDEKTQREFDGVVPLARGRAKRLLLQFTTELQLALGDPRAADTFEEAIANGFDDLGWVEGCPLVRGLHGDPRWSGWHATIAERARHVRLAWAASSTER